MPGLRHVVCANLPYNVTTPLLTAFLEAGCFETVTVMIQREVARRICAGPGTADYGAFGIFVQWHCETELLFDVPPSCFVPQPKVTSSVIRLTKPTRSARYPRQKCRMRELMFRVIRAAFNQRRKTLVNAVASQVPGVTKEDRSSKCSRRSASIPAIRGEVLDIGGFAKIADEINPANSKNGFVRKMYCENSPFCGNLRVAKNIFFFFIKERKDKMSKKYVYLFSEGNAKMRELLGGKGANLAEMSNIGLPVPQGFTITTEACTQYYEDGRQINDEIMAEIMKNVEIMEQINGKKFGDLENPLLVSVRSGARASMPGMMDTILNLGLNDDVVAAMIAGNPDPKFERFVYDSYRRFIQMFSDVVMEVGKKYFEQLIDEMKERKGVTFDVELTAADLKELAEQFKAEYKKQIGEDFPSDPVVQLKEAIRAVFRSWDNPRANYYRQQNDIPYSWGTAVNVMPMVFGNLNDNSGTGVAFTRDPATGEKKLMGEFLTNAQGEDVVAGVRTPMPISQMEEKFPEAYEQFVKVCAMLEDHYRDMQDMEFTVENGKLYMLQCRNGKRTAQAALKIACDLVDEGMIDEKQAVLMIEPAQPRHPAAPPVRRRQAQGRHAHRQGPGRLPRRRLRQDRLLR